MLTELKTPFVTVDIIIRYQGGIVMIERKERFGCR